MPEQDHTTNIPTDIQSIPKDILSRLRNIWRCMKTRCENPKHFAYKYYGGKGVTVCDRWKTFENFAIDVGIPLSPKHTLDRYPLPDGNYEPGNTRWATRSQQSRNKVGSVKVEVDGKTMQIDDWLDSIGIIEPRPRYLVRQGWSVEDALNIANGDIRIQDIKPRRRHGGKRPPFINIEIDAASITKRKPNAKEVVVIFYRQKIEIGWVWEGSYETASLFRTGYGIRGYKLMGVIERHRWIEILQAHLSKHPDQRPYFYKD